MVLRGITWQTYENLLTDLDEQSGTRLTYDRGVLEIITLTPEHESLNCYLASLVDLLVDELEMDVHPVGSSTFKREDRERGFEPDSSFYFQHAAQMRGKKRIDLTLDPAPELIIEIDISHGSLDKLRLFAQFGVEEVWRFDGATVHLYRLADGSYDEVESSSIFPDLIAANISEFLRQAQALRRSELKDWVRQTIISR
jgi:Uma2 family endonuclease